MSDIMVRIAGTLSKYREGKPAWGMIEVDDGGRWPERIPFKAWEGETSGCREGDRVTLIGTLRNRRRREKRGDEWVETEGFELQSVVTKCERASERKRGAADYGEPPPYDDDDGSIPF